MLGLFGTDIEKELDRLKPMIKEEPAELPGRPNYREFRQAYIRFKNELLRLIKENEGSMSFSENQDSIVIAHTDKHKIEIREIKDKNLVDTWQFIATDYTNIVDGKPKETVIISQHLVQQSVIVYDNNEKHYYDEKLAVQNKQPGTLTDTFNNMYEFCCATKKEVLENQDTISRDCR